MKLQTDRGWIDLPYKTDALTAMVVTITPEVAEWLIEYSSPRFHNRQINDARVNEYGQAMNTPGKWHLNGESMKLDTDSVLVDGWTRTWASVMSNATFRTVMSFGVDREAVTTIDIGRKRSPGNILHMLGETDATVLASALIQLHKYALGQSMVKNNRVSPDNLQQVLTEHPHVRESVLATKQIRRKNLGSPGVLVAAYHICWCEDSIAADTFFGLLGSGEGLFKNNPVYQLRERLIASRESNLPGERLGLILKAWQLWREDSKIQRLHAPEFPPIIKAFFAKEIA